MAADTDLTDLPALMEKATRVAGRRWEDLTFLPTLELLVRSCDATGALSASGRQVLSSIVVRHLVNRLLVEGEVAARPEVATRPLDAAVVVTGLPRTGTTLLHNLLGLDPGARVLRFWEALRPVPPGADEATSEAALVRQAATWLERLYALVPDFRAIHAATAEGPEECDALLQNEFASQHFDDMFNAEAYSAWLATAPLHREYRSYARQLNVLRRVEDGARPWVLKSPSHLGHLDALLAAGPDITIVQCHRHPIEAVPSYASLILTLRRAYSDDVSATVVGQQALQRCRVAVARALEVRQQAPSRFVDVSYPDLVSRPLATVTTLYEELGRRPPADLQARADGWMAQHPRHAHGVHRYTPESFGLTVEGIDQAFGPYLDSGLVPRA